MKGSMRIPSKFFVSGAIAAVSDDAKLLAGHLWTGPHVTVAGCFRLPTAYIAGDLGWTAERAATALAELDASGFIQRDERTGWTLIPSFLKANPIHNAQAGAGAVALLSEIPGALPLSDHVLEALRPFYGRLKPAVDARRSRHGAHTTRTNGAAEIRAIDATQAEV
jgi:hypothetical protein